jgi:hypothetical protein
MRITTSLYVRHLWVGPRNLNDYQEFRRDPRGSRDGDYGYGYAVDYVNSILGICGKLLSFNGNNDIVPCPSLWTHLGSDCLVELAYLNMRGSAFAYNIDACTSVRRLYIGFDVTAHNRARAGGAIAIRLPHIELVEEYVFHARTILSFYRKLLSFNSIHAIAPRASSWSQLKSDCLVEVTSLGTWCGLFAQDVESCASVRRLYVDFNVGSDNRADSGRVIATHLPHISLVEEYIFARSMPDAQLLEATTSALASKTLKQDTLVKPFARRGGYNSIVDPRVQYTLVPIDGYFLFHSWLARTKEPNLW